MMIIKNEPREPPMWIAVLYVEFDHRQQEQREKKIIWRIITENDIRIYWYCSNMGF